MRTFLFIAALCSLVPLAGHAQVFRAENRVAVVGVADGFEVRGDGGLGARGVWCAAADYARDVLGAHGFARLYIAEGRAPGLGQRDPVRFTLDPTGLRPTPVFVVGASLRTAGATLSVDHAQTFCADSKLLRR